MKRLKKLVALALVSTLTLVGCASNEKEANESEELRIGVMLSKPSVPLIVGKEMGFFEEAGVNVVVEKFTAPNLRDAAIQANEIDGMVSDIMTAMTYTDKGLPMTITSDINEDFKLLIANGKEINSVEELDGKDITLVPNYLGHYQMDVIAKKHNITYNLVPIPQIPARLEALKNGQVDASILGQPQSISAEKAGVKILADIEDDYNIKSGVIFFTKEFVDNNKTNLKNFYKGYNKTVEYLNSVDASEYWPILEKYGLQEVIVEYLNTDEAEFYKAAPIDEAQFEDVKIWAMEKELVKNDYKFDELTNFDYLKK